MEAVFSERFGIKTSLGESLEEKKINWIERSGFSCSQRRKCDNVADFINYRREILWHNIFRSSLNISRSQTAFPSLGAHCCFQQPWKRTNNILPLDQLPLSQVFHRLCIHSSYPQPSQEEGQWCPAGVKSLVPPNHCCFGCTSLCDGRIHPGNSKSSSGHHHAIYLCVQLEDPD